MRVSPGGVKRPPEFKEIESIHGSMTDDYMDFNTVSYQSTSTLRTISESFKAHAEKSMYRIPSYILTDRMNVSTTLSKDDFHVNKVLSRNSRCEVFSANVTLCPIVVIKKATTEAYAETAILNEIQILTKIKHQNIIAIRGARIAATEPFIVLEELGGGTLSDMIERRGGILPRGQALDFARQLACALQHLHEDLSPFAMGEEEGEEEEGTMVDGPLSDNLKLSDIEPERVIITTPMQLLIDQCTVHDYYLRPGSSVILRQLKDEILALARSHSISATVLRWGLRQGRAITNGISRALCIEHGN
eukprot:gene27405-36046_t